MDRLIKCIIVDDELIAREIIQSYIEKTAQLALIGSCKNVKEAIDITSRESVDLIFLDINMPEISGLTFAKILDNKIKIIFTTAHREYALDGFDVAAVDYLLKPISYDRFRQAIDKYISLHVIPHSSVEANDLPDFIFIRSERKKVKVCFKDIYYVESLSDYIKIYTNDGVLVTRETITNMEELLPRESFMRIHRSYIVSIEKIEAFTNEYVAVNHTTLPVSRTYKEAVQKRLRH